MSETETRPSQNVFDSQTETFKKWSWNKTNLKYNSINVWANLLIFMQPFKSPHTHTFFWLQWAAD